MGNDGDREATAREGRSNQRTPWIKEREEEQNPTHLGRLLLFLAAFISASSWNSTIMSCSNICLGPGQIAPPTTHPLIFPSLPLYNQTISSGAAEYHGPLAYHRFKKKGSKASHPLLSCNRGSTERESNLLEVTQLGSRGQG